MYGKIFDKNTFDCTCGETHRKLTETFIEDGAVSRVTEAVKKFIPFGHIGLVYMRDTEFIAYRVQKMLVQAGFRVSKFCYAEYTEPSVSVADDLVRASSDIRMFVGVGGGSVCDLIKYASYVREGRCIMLASAPSTDSFFFDFCEFFEDGERNLEPCRPPEYVIADLNIMSAAPKNLIAAGYGTLFSKYAALFDNKFESLVTGEKSCTALQENVKSILDNFFIDANNPDCADFTEKLTTALFAAGLWQQVSGKVDFLQGAEHYFARILKAYTDERLTEGENKFIASFTIINYYSKVIGFDGNDLLFPPDKVQSVKILSKAVNMNLAKNIVRLACDEKTDFGKTAYMLAEYREDLVSALREMTAKMKYAAKNFRRIYPDAGYFLREYITTEELMKIMSLSSVIRDRYGYLNYCKDAGYLEKYL